MANPNQKTPRKPTGRRRAGLVPSLIFSGTLAGAAVIPAVVTGCGGRSAPTGKHDVRSDLQFTVAQPFDMNLSPDLQFTVAAPFDMPTPGNG